MNTKSIKGKTNRYRYNLIILVSTLNFMNLKLNKYTQQNILYFLNGNLKRNNQNPVKIKTLQNYLYALEKKFQITLNYCKHLGEKCGSEVYYTLQYPKRECHFKINSHFKDIEQNKIKQFKERIKTYAQANGSLKWECINNYNNKEEGKPENQEEEILIKYIGKCKFKTTLPFFLLNLRISKELKIEHTKDLKKCERIINKLEEEDLKLLQEEVRQNGNTKGCIMEFLKNKGYLNRKYKGKQETKRKKLKSILESTKAELEEKYSKEHLSIEIDKIYETYKEKPHFIIEQDKYRDLEKMIDKIKIKIPICNRQESKIDDVKNNIFSILLEQLRHKVDDSVLIPALKKLINNKSELKYSKVFDNTYYYELLEMVE
ncbi:plasmid maintenance protein [Candidatus Borreliella tachyglossi]|uniref:plasmid maintenance protein n=1 Tax=Candidatus Borreliella tachyglossi TaxID=1964448 RepID=UPI004042E984